MQVWTGPILRDAPWGLCKPVMPARLGRVMHIALMGRLYWEQETCELEECSDYCGKRGRAGSIYQHCMPPWRGGQPFFHLMYSPMPKQDPGCC